MTLLPGQAFVEWAGTHAYIGAPRSGLRGGAALSASPASPAAGRLHGRHERRQLKPRTELGCEIGGMTGMWGPPKFYSELFQSTSGGPPNAFVNRNGCGSGPPAEK